ncbi:2-hydroxyacid dehydrogenase [Cellulomonas endophytica]|uniref:2-hydroxyacid dehydrogenase n=1 Tax=Cellulomonas endophytica TaxID=2494735 RepID=UPI001F0BBE0C|nr:2-hydroxyacid dehydrogenase [Cellulomonas endophytica]
MLTVTLPDDDLLARLADLDGCPVPAGTVLGSGSGVPGGALPAGRVRLVRWDVRSRLDPALAAEVDLVVIPHYFVEPGAFDALAQVPRLRLLQLPSAGYEHALPHLPPGVVLCNGRGIHDAGTAEHALGMVLAVQRGIDDSVRAMSTGTWAPRTTPSLADRRVLVVGDGSVARALGRRLAAFEVTLVRVASHARDRPDGHVHGVDELPALLPDADVVVLLVPLTDATRHLVDARFLASMRDGALLVNVARGAVVDTDALVAEVRTGRLRAALDVTDPEPLPADHPLWHLPGVLVTPHQGGNTDAALPRTADLVRRQVAVLLAGDRPLNVVAGA